MTENYSSSEHLSVVMTTTPVTSPSSGGFDFYFQCAVVVIGVIGTATNAFILYALVASEQHKKLVLIANQNALDLVSCLFLAVTYAVKLCNIQLSGRLGYWLCMLILNYNLLWCALIGSIVNLSILTVERYLKIVYPVFTKEKLSQWIIYSAAAFSWLAGFIYSNSATILTSAMADGVCYVQMFYVSKVAKIIHGVFNFVAFYLLVILIFFFCYGRILVVIRHQASVMATHSAAGPRTSQARSHQIQSNIIRTMILVGAFYSISWAPIAVYYLLLNLDAINNLTIVEGGFYATQLMSFLYICTNPFIYATKFDPVRRVLKSLVFCKKVEEPPAISIKHELTQRTGNRNQNRAATTRALQRLNSQV